jgi:hypothetical protein
VADSSALRGAQTPATYPHVCTAVLGRVADDDLDATRLLDQLLLAFVGSLWPERFKFHSVPLCPIHLIKVARFHEAAYAALTLKPRLCEAAASSTSLRSMRSHGLGSFH